MIVGLCFGTLLLCVGLSAPSVLSAASLNLATRSLMHDESYAVVGSRLWAMARDARSGSPRAHLGQGIALLQQGELKAATATLQTAISLSPDDAMIAYWLGEAYARQMEIDSAIPYWVQAGAGPSQAIMYREMGEKLAGEGQAQQAAQYYLWAIRLDPLSALTYLMLGDLYRTEGRTTESVAEYLKAIDADPDFIWAHMKIGDLYLDQHDYALADYWYQKATVVAPERSEPWVRLGLSALRRGSAGEAAMYFQTAVLLDQTNDAVLFLLQRSVEGQADSEFSMTIYCELWRHAAEGTRAHEFAVLRTDNGTQCLK